MDLYIIFVDFIKVQILLLRLKERQVLKQQ